MPAKANYDHPWKDAIEDLFPQMIQFFRKRLYNQIDWSQNYVFLDKELRQIMPADGARRYVDKLVSVVMKDGIQELLYIHIEMQNERDDAFPERMYVYNYRLFDKYGGNVFSLAILGDLNPRWRPQTYRRSRHGTSAIFKFPVIKLLDFGAAWEKLEKDSGI